MKIVVGSDHTGFELKNEIIEYLKENNYEVIDVSGEFDPVDDYPDVAERAANEINTGNAEKGILICGTGVGIGIAANKIKGIRCGTCNDEYLAKMSRADNDTNMIAIGARVIDVEKAKGILDVWLNTEFLGEKEERHQRRVNKIMELENK